LHLWGIKDFSGHFIGRTSGVTRFFAISQDGGFTFRYTTRYRDSHWDLKREGEEN
jgi:hypothetical protein